jgi:hypothetical protein
LAFSQPAPHPAGLDFFNPPPEQKSQYPHMFGVCGAGRIDAGWAGWALLFHYRLFCTSNKQTQVEVTQPNRQHQTIQTYKQ